MYHHAWNQGQTPQQPQYQHVAYPSEAHQGVAYPQQQHYNAPISDSYQYQQYYQAGAGYSQYQQPQHPQAYPQWHAQQQPPLPSDQPPLPPDPPAQAIQPPLPAGNPEPATHHYPQGYPQPPLPASAPPPQPQHQPMYTQPPLPVNGSQGHYQQAAYPPPFPSQPAPQHLPNPYASISGNSNAGYYAQPEQTQQPMAHHTYPQHAAPVQQYLSGQAPGGPSATHPPLPEPQSLPLSYSSQPHPDHHLQPVPLQHLQQPPQQQHQQPRPQQPPMERAAASAVPTAAAVKQSLEALRPLMDAVTLFRQPGRLRRPRRLLLILRGLPGSGKSHLAKLIRDIEVEEGGEAPRVHSLDEYFMTEVEKEVEEEGPRGKSRKRKVTETEYEYDASMADAYQRSLVRAVCKTLEEGRFSVVIMDAPNMQLSHFMDVVPATQRHHYTTYLLQPLETDPVLCAKRNVHGHSEQFVSKMADSWEPAPNVFDVLDGQRLLGGKVQGASAIQEVDMDDEGKESAGAQGAVGSSGKDSAAPPAGKQAAGASAASPASAALSSRWARSLEEDAAEGEDARVKEGVARKRSRTRHEESDSEILKELSSALTTGNGGTSSSLLAREAEMREALAAARRTLRRNKRVRWRDMPEADTEGNGGGQAEFRMRAPPRPLCEVFVLEGLGPARGETALVWMDATSPLLSGRHLASFADAVKAEHSKEHQVLAALHDGAIKADEE